MSRVVSFVVVVWILFTGSAFTKDLITAIDWKRSKVAGSLVSGEVISAEKGDPGDILRLSHSGPGPVTLKILTLEKPPITKFRYAIVGKVKYQTVQGKGFLEMWSHFPDGSRYFSRTLAEVGPMGAISGDSSWRDLVLPFFSRPGVPPPSRIELNLILPDSGTVYLSPLNLYQYEESENPSPD